MEFVNPEESNPVISSKTHLLKNGLERMYDFAERMADLDDTLASITDLGGDDLDRKVEKLQKQLQLLEPSVTMIGQIKAGKTSLVNAMVGQPELMPADVNPWTSVVTSLHINAVREGDAPTATFQFFDQNEWDHLVESGGRIGELASRAGASEELTKVRGQITQMRDKTRERLGKKFELLLGQKHEYGYVDDDLVQRYVCMGDDFEDAGVGTDQQGRFADITKSADLYMKRPEIPMPLCIRDTPGVNDTFMMREQITINALRESRLCVVVLSAHQALTSMDMALIRLISNVKSRDVVIFVNRIDELAHPAEQVPEIRDSIIATLKANDGPKDPHIIFGSAYWANMALTTELKDIAPDSAKALFNWADVTLGDDDEDLAPADMVWELSGVPALYDALSERMIEGVCNETLDRTARRALNLTVGLRASSQVVSAKIEGNAVRKVDKQALENRISIIEKQALNGLAIEMDAAASEFSGRIEQSHNRFLDRALESLMQHLEKHGENQSWKYSPQGLRMLLRSSYQVLSRKATSAAEDIYLKAANNLTNTYLQMMNVSVEGFAISPPNAPPIPAPVSLGQTIALDLQTAWWKGWWKRRKGYRAFASGFYDLIKAETAPIVDELTGPQVDVIRENARKVLEEFLSEQRAILSGVAGSADLSEREVKDLFGVTAQEERESMTTIIFDELKSYIDADADAEASQKDQS